jgi:hypothetical protein
MNAVEGVYRGLEALLGPFFASLLAASVGGALMLTGVCIVVCLPLFTVATILSTPLCRFVTHRALSNDRSKRLATWEAAPNRAAWQRSLPQWEKEYFHYTRFFWSKRGVCYVAPTYALILLFLAIRFAIEYAAPQKAHALINILTKSPWQTAGGIIGGLFCLLGVFMLVFPIFEFLWIQLLRFAPITRYVATENALYLLGAGPMNIGGSRIEWKEDTSEWGRRLSDCLSHNVIRPAAGKRPRCSFGASFAVARRCEKT